MFFVADIYKTNMKTLTTKKIRALNQTGAGKKIIEKNTLTRSQEIFAEAANPGKKYNGLQAPCQKSGYPRWQRRSRYGGYDHRTRVMELEPLLRHQMLHLQQTLPGTT